MRTSTPAFLLAGILSLTASAKAGIVTISFDELQVGEEVLNYYNGGFGSLGTGPGPNFGVSFYSAWIAEPPDVYGHPGRRSAEISGDAIMNVAGDWSADWIGYVSFYYFGAALEVDFYDQQNGLGNLLATWNLPAVQALDFNPAGAPCRSLALRFSTPLVAII